MAADGKRKGAAARFTAGLLGLFLLLANLGPSGVEAQVGSGRPVHVAVLLSRSIAPYEEGERGLEVQLHRALGPRLQTFQVMQLYRWKGREEELARWVVTRHMDIIFCLGRPALELARGLFKKIPVVFGFVLDSDLETPLPPNVAGVFLNPSLERRVRLLARITGGRRFGLVARRNPRWEGLMAAVDPSITLLPRWIRGPGELPAALDSLAAASIDGFLMVPDSRIFGSIPSIDFTILWGLRHRIPVMGLSKGYVKRGALCALEPDYYQMGRQLALMGARLLQGPRPRRATAYPQELRLSINLTTLRRLGLQVPHELLQEAEAVE